MFWWALGLGSRRWLGKAFVTKSRLGPIMILAVSAFPKSIPITTEVRVRLTFFTIKNSVNILLIRQSRALLPTLPLYSPIFLKLLSGMGLHFRAFCYRLTRKCPPSEWLRRDFRNCRIRCTRLPTVLSFVEVMIDVSPPVRRSNLRSLGAKTSKRKPIR